MPPSDRERTERPDHEPEDTALPIFGECRLGDFVLDWAEAVEATEVVHAVHVGNPTAISSLYSNFSAVLTVSVRCAHLSVRLPSPASPSIGIGAVAIAPMAPPRASRTADCVPRRAADGGPCARGDSIGVHPQSVPVLQPDLPVRRARRDHRADRRGADARDVPRLARVDGLATAGDRGRRGVGHRPGEAAVTPLINNDVFLVVPKAFHAPRRRDRRGNQRRCGGIATPGELLQAVQNGRTNILDALDQPVGPPTTPTGATNILQVVAVEAVNVTTAVAFQAGELLLAGVVQIDRRRGAGIGAVR